VRQVTILGVLLSFIICLAYVDPARAQATFKRTYTFPGTIRVGCCNGYTYGFSPVIIDPTVVGERIQITSIFVSATGAINSPDLLGDAGLDWEVLVGPSSFGLPIGQITASSKYPGFISSSSPTQFRFAEIDHSASGSVTFSGSYNFQTNGFVTNAQVTNLKAAFAAPTNLRQGLFLQVFVWSGAIGASIDFSGITVTVSGTIPPPSFSLSQSAISFPDQPVNGASSSMAETFTNTSSSIITLGTFVITGPDAPSFTGSVDNCYERTMPPNDSCTIDLAFSPGRIGAHQASLRLNDILDTQLQIVPLTGTAIGTPPSNSPPTYNVSIVGEPWPAGAQRVDFSALNNHGDLAGWLSFENSSCLDSYGSPATYSHAFLYRSGSFTDLGTLPNAFVANQPSCYPPSSVPTDKHISGIGALNDSGVLVGTADGSNGQSRAFIYTGGRIHDIQELVTDGTVLPDSVGGIAINRIDQVLLNRGVCSSWIFDSGKVFPLELPANLPPCNNGDIVGPWPSHSLEINRPYLSGVAVPNDDGRSAADADLAIPTTFDSTAAIFENGLFTDLGIPGGTSSINSAGQVVGFASSNFSYEPFYWDRTSGKHSLTSLVPSGWTITGGGPLRAVINDAAQILTAGQGPDSKFHYVLLSPVVSTPSGTNVNVQSGGTTLTFSNVSSTGTTSVTPIDPATIGQVPGGFAVSGSVAYTISSTATFSGLVTLAFKVPGPISQTDFNNLSILHNDSVLGLVDVTASSPARDFANLLVYATTNSFSPFYLAKRGNHILPLFNQKGIYKGGSTIPVKLQVFDPNNQNISSPNLQVQARTLRLLSSNVSGPVVSSGNANPDNNFRFDSTIGTGGGYIYNLSTKGLAQGLYSLSFYVGADHTFLYVVTFEIK
jgi:probable HAF family extracellular repeat protein